MNGSVQEQCLSRPPCDWCVPSHMVVCCTHPIPPRRLYCRALEMKTGPDCAERKRKRTERLHKHEFDNMRVVFFCRSPVSHVFIFEGEKSHHTASTQTPIMLNRKIPLTVIHITSRNTQERSRGETNHRRKENVKTTITERYRFRLPRQQKPVEELRQTTGRSQQ